LFHVELAAESAFQEIAAQYPTGITQTARFSMPHSFRPPGQDSDKQASPGASAHAQEMSNEHTELLQQVEILRLELEAHFGNDVGTHADGIQVLKQNVQALLASNRSMTERCTRHEAELQASQAKIEVAELEVTKTKDAAKSEHQEWTQRLQDMINDAGRRQEATRNERDEKATALEALQSELESLKKKYAAVHQKEESLSAQVAVLQQVQVKAQEEIECLTDDKNKLQEQMGLATVQVTALQQVQAALGDEKQLALERLVKAQEEIASLTDDKNKLQEQMGLVTAALQEEHSKNMAKATQAAAQIAAQTEERERERQEQLALQQEKLSRLEFFAMELELAKTKHETQLREVTLELEETKRLHAMMSTELAGVRESMQELQHSRDSLQEIIREKDDVEKALHADNNSITRQLQEALEQMRAKCDEVSAKEVAEKVVRGDLNACQQKLHDAQALLQVMAEQSLSQQHDLDALRAEVAQLQDNLSSARVDADGRFAEQSKSLAMKDADIAEKQREIDSIILDYDERLRSHIASLEAKDEKIKVQDNELMDKQRTIDGLTSRVEEGAMQLATKDEELGARERELSQARLIVAEQGAAMEKSEVAWSGKCESTASSLREAESELARFQTVNAVLNDKLEANKQHLQAVLKEKETVLKEKDDELAWLITSKEQVSKRACLRARTCIHSRPLEPRHTYQDACPYVYRHTRQF
jgi:hypothetical protein